MAQTAAAARSVESASIDVSWAVSGLNEQGDMVGRADDGTFSSGFPNVTPALWSGSSVTALSTFGITGPSMPVLANQPSPRINNLDHILRANKLYTAAP